MRALALTLSRCACLTATLALANGCSQAQQLTWQPFSGSIPVRLGGPTLVSEPITLSNPMLRTLCDQWYRLPWAPGEAMVLSIAPRAENVQAFGLWAGTKEFQLLVRAKGGWEEVTPKGRHPASKPKLIYFGHDAYRTPEFWTQPPRAIVVGEGAEQAVQARRVRLWEAGCTAMVLERGQRELVQARQFLREARKPHPKVKASVESAEQAILGTRAELDRRTEGLLNAYMALPEPQYALEVVAWAIRCLYRGDSLKKMGLEDCWQTVFYGRPEFQPCIEARIAAQEALWSERPETLQAESKAVFGAGAPLAASITHGLGKFRRDKPFPEPLKTAYRLSLARDEFESFQVVAASTGQKLRNVRVSVEWKGAGPHPQVLVRPVGYVQTKPDPDNFAEYIGWWPDPLLPPGAVDVAAGETQPFWGTVHATKDTPAGDHGASVTITADAMPPLRCKLTAHVFGFDLGLTHLPSLLALSFDSIKRFYRIDGEVSQEVKRRWYEFCLQYRMNPNVIYGTGLQPGEEDLDFCVQRGFNAMVVSTPPLYRETRNRRDTVELWASDDNVTYRRVDGPWTLKGDLHGNLLFEGLEVTTRYLKVHSLLTDRGGQFAIPNLQTGQFTAHDKGQPYTGPAGYAGADDGTKPLTSFNANWGAALDYERASIGVDLGQQRRITRMQVGSKQFEEVQDIKRFYDLAKAHGLGNRAYVYGFDEWADVKTYDQIRDTFSILKARAPGLKACTTASQPVPPATEVVDAWCPALCYQHAEYEAERKRGKEIWYYEGGAPYDPFPTHELLNVPAVEARAFFWIAWRYQLAGWLHWELNYWVPNFQGEGRWPEVPWDPARGGIRNGEVGRIYPGPNITPLPSVRLENMRDGIEDYDYFWLLNDALSKLPKGDRRKAAGQKLIRESILALCPSRAHFERDPETVLAVHERLGKTIEGLRR